MKKYRKKPVVVNVMTFDEMVQHGIENAENLVDGVPWSFEINGHRVTHENDKCYLLLTLEGVYHMTPKDMLIIGVKGEIYPCKKDIFKLTYEAAE